MPHYFYLHDERQWRDHLAPVLTTCWRLRRWQPLLPWLGQVTSLPADSLAAEVLAGAPFQRQTWTTVVGELLVLAAEDVPRIEIEPLALCGVVCGADWQERSRSDFHPIHQIFLGSQDLRFGAAFYRPLHAGWNDLTDVSRLLFFLESMDPATWRLEAKDTSMGELEKQEELEYLQQGWADLVKLYRKAHHHGWMVVAEDSE